MTKVFAIFDIGKTNKKFLLFDYDFHVVYEESKPFDETKDEDGFPCDDLPYIIHWIDKCIEKVMGDARYEVTHINFSTYGASLVHIDDDAKLLTPLYNYLKPFDDTLFNEFMQAYGPVKDFEAATGSPSAGFLNVGFQLYWLKKNRNDIFEKIKYTLNFPQYLSYHLTGKPYADYTSLGCHTSMWDYESNQYHSWLSKENIAGKLLPVVSPKIVNQIELYGKEVNVGIGIHDSSAALLPYLKFNAKPFLLISTGTWSISLNPFYDKNLTTTDIENNCLNYIQADGKSVRATRLFLGQEYKEQVEKLNSIYKKDLGYDRKVKFSLETYNDRKNIKNKYFNFNHLIQTFPANHTFDISISYEEAYHQLMIELCKYQIEAIHLAIGDSSIEEIYIDGGFIDNEVYVKILAHTFSNKTIYTASSSIGSALGAAVIMIDKLPDNFMKNHYNLNQIKI